MSLFKKYQAQMAEQAAKAQAIISLATEQNREISTEEQSEIDACHKAINDLEPKAKQMAEVEAKASSILASTGYKPSLEIDAGTKISFKASSRSKHYKDPAEAYAMGKFVHALLGNTEASQKSRQWCRDNGIILNVHSEGVNTAGGYLVPEIMESSIINLKENYGVARRNAFVYPMSSDAVSVPRRQSGFTVYYVGENATGTESDLGFSQVRLDAKKAMIITRLSSELNEDSVVALADLVTQEMAYAFAVSEDQAVFLGDGTSTYGGIVGLRNSLLAGSTVTAAAGDNTFAELEWAFFEEAVGKCAQFPGIQPKWYVHSAFFYTAMARLANAAGGNTKGDIANGYAMQFMGYPVEFTQALPSSTGDLASTIVGFFGDLSMAGTLGSRRGVTVAADASRYFELDQLAIRGTQRWDWNGHETGTASVAGPMIALKMGTA